MNNNEHRCCCCVSLMTFSSLLALRSLCLAAAASRRAMARFNAWLMGLPVFDTCRLLPPPLSTASCWAAAEVPLKYLNDSSASSYVAQMCVNCSCACWKSAPPPQDLPINTMKSLLYTVQKIIGCFLSSSPSSESSCCWADNQQRPCGCGCCPHQRRSHVYIFMPTLFFSHLPYLCSVIDFWRLRVYLQI